MLLLKAFSCGVSQVSVGAKLSYNPGVAFPNVWQCPQATAAPAEFAANSQSREDMCVIARQLRSPHAWPDRLPATHSAVYEHFFSKPTPLMQGFFVELGALDGLKYSSPLA